MKKVVGVLGCSGAVGTNVMAHLGERYDILGGQRKEVPLKYGKWVFADIFDPVSLKNFCKQCDVVINAAGPSTLIKGTVAECCAKLGVDYVDISGESIYIERTGPKFEAAKNSFVIGAGLEAGLSGLLPYYLKRNFDEIEIANCYLGSRERISRSSLVDVLGSCFIDSGYANACYDHGEIKPVTSTLMEGKQKILGFCEDMYLKPYISNEIISMAKKCEMGRVTWYHAIADEQIMEILASMFETVSNIEQEDFQKVLVDKYMPIFEAIANTKPRFNTLVYDFLGTKNGEKLHTLSICQIDEGYLVCGAMAAFAAEQVLQGNVAQGISWACDILDPVKTVEYLLNNHIIRDLKTIDMGTIGESEELEDGEI